MHNAAKSVGIESENVGDKAKDAARDMQQSARKATHQAGEKISDASSDASRFAQRAYDKASDYEHEVGDKLKQGMEKMGVETDMNEQRVGEKATDAGRGGDQAYKNVTGPSSGSKSDQVFGQKNVGDKYNGGKKFHSPFYVSNFSHLTTAVAGQNLTRNGTDAHDHDAGAIDKNSSPKRKLRGF